MTTTRWISYEGRCIECGADLSPCEDSAGIESIRKTTLNPEDVIVIRLDKTAVKPAIIESIVDRLRDIFPHNKVIALMHGVDLEIITPDQTDRGEG
jgi:hypothetical protein